MNADAPQLEHRAVKRDPMSKAEHFCCRIGKEVISFSALCGTEREVYLLG